jgi:LacI family transcriptional regulator
VAAVRAAAAELAYVPNAQAQALARSRTGILGLVVHDISDPYFSTVAAAAQQVATEHGHMTMLATSQRQPEREVDAVETFVAHQANGIVLAGTRHTNTGSHAEQLQAVLHRYIGTGGRICTVGQSIPEAHAIVPENHAGAHALATALLEAGHREFAILSGPPELVTAADRTSGFMAGLIDRRVEPLAVVPGEFTRDGGFNAAQHADQLLQLAHRRACIFAVNDVMAIGAIAALRTLGLTIPTQVGVAGFDDIQTLRDHHPSLSTVRLPLSGMGERAAELVLFSDESVVAEPVIEHVTGNVLLRESTALAS